MTSTVARCLCTVLLLLPLTAACNSEAGGSGGCEQDTTVCSDTGGGSPSTTPRN